MTCSCNTKTPTPESKLNNESRQINIDDLTVDSVLTYLFKNKSSNPFLKYDKVAESAGMPFFLSFYTDSIEIVKLDSIFTSTDFAYMRGQKTQFYKFKLDQSKFNYKTIISEDSLGLAKNYPFCYISFPVFNTNKDKFILRAGYVCGIFCAEDAIFIYKKEGNSWKIIKVLNQTIS